MKFIAVDVETANADLASICQIGIVTFSDQQVTDTWQTLINPEDEFDPFNILIHGITEEMVANAPIFPKFVDRIYSELGNQIVASHMPFDRIALGRALDKYNLPPLECTWLDSARVARRAWTQFAYSGYSLANLAKEQGISFSHHIAAEDARASGEIILKAIEETGISLDEWLERITKPIFPSTSSTVKITRDGNPEGHLFGETVVFTGALTMPRATAADIAANAGCQVDPSVTQRTTMLVVGNQDIRRLAGHEKSSKHRKAEEFIARGQKTRILCEDDFMRIVKL